MLAVLSRYQRHLVHDGARVRALHPYLVLFNANPCPTCCPASGQMPSFAGQKNVQECQESFRTLY